MSREHFEWRRLLAVFFGGFLGTIIRYLLSRAIQGTMGTGWPYDILLINVTGAFMLAFLTILAEAALLIGPMRRLLLNVGFLGAYTTFSSLALGDITLFSSQKLFLGLLYLLMSLFGGIVAVLLGQISGLRLVRWLKPVPVSAPDALGKPASTQSLQQEEQTY